MNSVSQTDEQRFSLQTGIFCPLCHSPLGSSHSLFAEVPGHVGLPEAVEFVESLGQPLGGLQVGLVPIGQVVRAAQGQPLRHLRVRLRDV